MSTSNALQRHASTCIACQDYKRCPENEAIRAADASASVVPAQGLTAALAAAMRSHAAAALTAARVDMPSVIGHSCDPRCAADIAARMGAA